MWDLVASDNSASSVVLENSPVVLCTFPLTGTFFAELTLNNSGLHHVLIRLSLKSECLSWDVSCGLGRFEPICSYFLSRWSTALLRERNRTVKEILAPRLRPKLQSVSDRNILTSKTGSSYYVSCLVSEVRRPAAAGFLPVQLVF